MDLTNISLLGIATCFTSVISAVLSLAGGTVLLSIMTLILPVSTIIPLHGANQLMSNFWRTFLMRRHIHFAWFYSFIWGSVIGTVLATMTLKYVLDLRYASLFIALLIFYSLFKPKKTPTIKVGKRGFLLVGLLIGYLSMFLGATGLILGSFFVGTSLNKNEVTATQAAMQTFNHALKVAGFIYLGFNFQPWLIILAVMMLGSILGTSLGVKLLGKLSEEFFFKLYRLILFLSALNLIRDFAKTLFNNIQS